MINPWLAMGSVLAAMVVLLAAVRLWQRHSQPPSEVTRKCIHVAMGLVVLSFPWAFDRVWPVVVVGLVAALMMWALRIINTLRADVGRVVNDVDRAGYGEVYYPLAVALLFAVSGGDRLMFVIPVLILTLADAVAALIGLYYGKLRYTTADGLKSMEGSVAFFTVSFLSTHVPLLLFADVGRAQSLLLAFIIGLVVMLVEAASWRGLDNLFVPIGAYTLLSLYIDQPVTELAWRLAATGALVVFVFAWRRRTSLDDSALIGAALFGYAAWMFGGWLWLIAPAILFTTHSVLWPRAVTGQRHTVHAVLSVTAAGLAWLFADVFTQTPASLFAYNTAFAAHLAIIGVSRLRGQMNDGPVARWMHPLAHATWATALGLGPWIVLQGIFDERLSVDWLLMRCGVGWVAVVTAAAGFFVLLPRLYRPHPRAALIHAAGTALGLAASLIAAIMIVLLA